MCAACAVRACVFSLWTAKRQCSNRGERAAYVGPACPFLVSLLPLDIAVVGPPKSPRNSFDVANMTQSNQNRLGFYGAAWQPVQWGARRRGEGDRLRRRKKQEEMIIVSSGTHITPGHTTVVVWQFASISSSVGGLMRKRTDG